MLLYRRSLMFLDFSVPFRIGFLPVGPSGGIKKRYTANSAMKCRHLRHLSSGLLRQAWLQAFHLRGQKYALHTLNIYSTYICVFIGMYIYIYVCVCVCMCVCIWCSWPGTPESWLWWSSRTPDRPSWCRPQLPVVRPCRTGHTWAVWKQVLYLAFVLFLLRDPSEL